VQQGDDWSWVEDDDDTWVPPAVDYTKPSVARIYDYGLGGKDNYPVDREVAEKFMAAVPDTRLAARANRAFLTEVVTAMAEAGITQFLDQGTGIPTSPNVHETVRAVHPDARIVYVDNDPIVLAHNRALLGDDPNIAVLPHDIRQPTAIMEDRRTQELLDLSRPVGVLMIAVLHFVDAATAPFVVGRYLRDLTPGSQLAISGLSSHGIEPEVLRQTERAYGSVAAPLVYRTLTEIEALFDKLEMIRPVHDVYRSPSAAVLGGVAVKP
jgi:S-adenosyl methyltransferase